MNSYTKISRKIRKFNIFILAFTILATPFVVLAQGDGGGLINPLSGSDGEVTSFPQLIKKILEKVVIPIGSVVVIFFFIYSGFLFVTAQGSENKLKTAKTAFTWTVVGALVLLGSSVFADIICETISDLGAQIQCST